MEVRIAGPENPAPDPGKGGSRWRRGPHHWGMNHFLDDIPSIHHRALVRGGQLTLARMYPNPVCTIAAANADLTQRLDTLSFAPDSLFFYLQLEFSGDGGTKLTGQKMGSRAPSTRIEALSRGVILRWAALMRIEAVVFEDEIYEVTPAVIIGDATVTCPTCGQVLTAGDEQFWLTAREMGQMPSRCRPCGGTLPQWEVPAEYPAPNVHVSLLPDLEGDRLRASTESARRPAHERARS